MKLKLAITNFLTNKWVLNIVSLIALLNVIGYMIIGNFNNVIVFDGLVMNSPIMVNANDTVSVKVYKNLLEIGSFKLIGSTV